MDTAVVEVFAYSAGAIFSITILYFVIKGAVRNGIMQAFQKMPAIKVIMEAEAIADEKQDTV